MVLGVILIAVFLFSSYLLYANVITNLTHFEIITVILTVCLIVRELSGNLMSTLYLYMNPPCKPGGLVHIPEFPHFRTLRMGQLGLFQTELVGVDDQNRQVVLWYSNRKLAGGSVARIEE